MELDDLKSLWQETDRRLQAMEPALRVSLRLGIRDARERTVDRTRSRLRWVRVTLWYEVVFAAMALLLIGSYLADHISEARFAVPAVLLHLGVIALLGTAVRQLLWLREIDFAGPVVSMQRRLAEVGVLRARTNRAILIGAPLLWALLVVVVPHDLVGLDVYSAFGLPWVLGNFLVGVLVLAVFAWASRRFPASSRVATFLSGLGDDLTGRRLLAASAGLDEVAAFEAEA